MIWRCFVLCMLLVLVSAIPPVLAGEFVADVQVQGNHLVETSSITAVLSVKPGQEITPADVDRDIRAIYALGRFQDVSALITEDNGVKTLVYRVEERPLVRLFTFQGNDEFSSKDLMEKTGLKLPLPFDPAKIDKAVEAIQEKYKNKGYYAAKVSYTLNDDLPGAAEVIFTIDEGPEAKIRSIRFEGNAHVSADVLEKAMITKTKGWFSFLDGSGTYREEVIPADIAALEEVYQNRGYIQAKVKRPVVTLNEDRDGLTLLFEIEEGRQFRVGDVGLQGDFKLDKAEVEDKILLKSGEIFDRSAMRKSLVGINDLFANRGYAYVNVTPLTHIEAEKQLVNVTFDVSPGKQVYINRINISGNQTTLDKVIRREMRLQEGDLYSAAKLNESRKRVKNTGYFEEVGVSTHPTGNPRYMDLDVGVTEHSTGMFTVGAGYDTSQGAVVSASITERNFMGHGLNLIATGSLGETNNVYRLSITDPYFLDYDLTAGFDLYKTEQDWDEFSRDVVGGRFKLGWELSDTWRTLLTYTYETKTIRDVSASASDIIKSQVGDSTLSAVGVTFSRDTTDYRFDPREGALSRINLQLAGLGGDEKFLKLTGEHTRFFPLLWDTVFVASGNFGYAWGYDGDPVPIDERFFLGGIGSLRGFDNRKVGPKDGSSYIGGETDLYFNFDYVFPLSEKSGLKGAVFFDTGNAWEDAGEILSDMRYSAGLEVRWRSPMGPLRVGYGFNLFPKSGESRGAVVFSFGTFY